MGEPTDYLQLLAKSPATGGTESVAAMRTDAATRSELLERLRAEVAYVAKKTGAEVGADDLEALVSEAGVGLERLFADGDTAALGPGEMSGLEAVIRADGSRPVLFVEDDFVDVLAPSIGQYATRLSVLEQGVRQVCRSVGRVDDPSPMAKPLGYQGTAWMLAEGLVVTNFHVLQAIAPGGTRESGRFQGRLNTGVAVHFGHEVGNDLPERRFPIRRVVSVGREGAADHTHPEVSSLDFDGLDLAVLELEPVPGRPFPSPCRVARAEDKSTKGRMATAGHEVYLVGYPGASRSTTPDLFAKIFAGVKSFKRLAPGQILAGPGDLPATQDPHGWVLTHDASTLGGNSGSAVVDLEADGKSVLGLHFAGAPLRQNWAHATEKLGSALNAVLPAPQDRP
jgi:hypothetical protein